MRPAAVELSHLDTLEAESIHIIREVAAEFERPVLLFSGGKDSIVMLRLAEKAFWPAPHPVPGHARRHRPQLPRGASSSATAGSPSSACGWWWPRCRSRSTPGGSVEETGPRASRNRCRPSTLLDAIEEHGFDAVFGGARRDEEKARAKERVFSFRDEFGQWDPKNQRPELWSLYNGRTARASTSASSRCRTGPSSTSGSTSPSEEHRAAVDLLRARARGVRARRHAARGHDRSSTADGGRGAVRGDACATAPSAT